VLSTILWHAVKGENTPEPARRYSLSGVKRDVDD
jgi:hypothetical protein